MDIRYITKRYNQLQGLRLLPIALLFLLLAGRELTRGVVLADPPGDLLLRGSDAFGMLALVLIAASFWVNKRIGQWYADNYGTVKDDAHDDRIILVIAAVLLAASWADTVVTGVNVFGLALAVMVGLYWSMNREQWHYLGAAVIIALLSFVPGMGTLGMALAGALLLVTVGLLDHMIIVRALGPAEGA